MTFPSAVAGRGAFAAFQAAPAVLSVLVELYLNACMGQRGWMCCVAAPSAGVCCAWGWPQLLQDPVALAEPPDISQVFLLRLPKPSLCDLQ